MQEIQWKGIKNRHDYQRAIISTLNIQVQHEMTSWIILNPS